MCWVISESLAVIFTDLHENKRKKSRLCEWMEVFMPGQLGRDSQHHIKVWITWRYPWVTNIFRTKHKLRDHSTGIKKGTARKQRQHFVCSAQPALLRDLWCQVWWRARQWSNTAITKPEIKIDVHVGDAFEAPQDERWTNNFKQK